jgi:hypothetical protein
VQGKKGEVKDEQRKRERGGAEVREGEISV